MFRDLFRQLSSPSASVEGVSEVSGVFVIPGHVFIATLSNSEKGKFSNIQWMGIRKFIPVDVSEFVYAGQAKLYAFNCTLPEKDFKVHENCVTSSLQLGEGCSKVINVIKGCTNQQIYVVQYSNIL